MMKKVGYNFVTSIDDINRVLIPKELRKKLDLKPGDRVEISLNEEGQIILIKYKEDNK
ncbi:MAG: AbrB/MazE/SpoVT family DNA-binding domain-containing protein [Deltaproteobacteria bacterium]